MCVCAHAMCVLRVCGGWGVGWFGAGEDSRTGLRTSACSAQLALRLASGSLPESAAFPSFSPSAALTLQMVPVPLPLNVCVCARVAASSSPSPERKYSTEARGSHEQQRKNGGGQIRACRA